MAFNKAMMSLLGFLRFVPSSRFYAKERKQMVDLSSACVLARQVLEDLLALFYLAQPNLCAEQKEFRIMVWKYHGFCEGVEASGLANSTNPDLVQARAIAEARATADQLRQKVEQHPLFQVKSSTDKGRILKGQIGCLLYDEEILAIRGINPNYYRLPRKVLSNFAHISALSVSYHECDQPRLEPELGRIYFADVSYTSVCLGRTRTLRTDLPRNQGSHLSRRSATHRQIPNQSPLIC
jgi:hypothetical protein